MKVLYCTGRSGTAQMNTVIEPEEGAHGPALFHHGFLLADAECLSYALCAVKVFIELNRIQLLKPSIFSTSRIDRNEPIPAPRRSDATTSLGHQAIRIGHAGFLAIESLAVDYFLPRIMKTNGNNDVGNSRRKYWFSRLATVGWWPSRGRAIFNLLAVNRPSGEVQR